MLCGRRKGSNLRCQLAPQANNSSSNNNSSRSSKRLILRHLLVVWVVVGHSNSNNSTSSRRGARGNRRSRHRKTRGRGCRRIGYHWRLFCSCWPTEWGLAISRNRVGVAAEVGVVAAVGLEGRCLLERPDRGNVCSLIVM